MIGAPSAAILRPCFTSFQIVKWPLTRVVVVVVTATRERAAAGAAAEREGGVRKTDGMRERSQL